MSIELIVKNKLPLYDVYLQYNDYMISLNVNHHPKYGLELSDPLYYIDHFSKSQSWFIERDKDFNSYDLPKDYYKNPMEVILLLKDEHKDFSYLSYHSRCKEQEEILMIKFDKYNDFLGGVKTING